MDFRAVVDSCEKETLLQLTMIHRYTRNWFHRSGNNAPLVCLRLSRRHAVSEFLARFLYLFNDKHGFLLFSFLSSFPLLYRAWSPWMISFKFIGWPRNDRIIIKKLCVQLFNVIKWIEFFGRTIFFFFCIMILKNLLNHEIV